MDDLDKIRVVHSGLGDTIYLARFGKNPAYALDKREAEADVISAVVAHMMHDAPKGSKKDVCVNGKWYELQVRPSPTKTGAAEDNGTVTGND